MAGTAKKTDKTTDKTTDKRLANLREPWKKGDIPNPKGRPLGTRNRRTVILDALRLIGEKKNLTPDQIENAIQVSGIEKALKGSFMHYDAISSGLYGKMTDRTDITSGGKTLADLITLANAKRKPAGRSTPEVQG